MTTESALDCIREERENQKRKWGNQDHDPSVWLQILMEEVGEYSEACLHDQFGGPKAGTSLKELIQIAAVATQMIERHSSK